MRLVLIGLLAGFFSALFGVGGGTIIVPLLLLLCSWEARSATATSLASIGITAVSAAWVETKTLSFIEAVLKAN